jgi:secreted trypsin-like serine protease
MRRVAPLLLLSLVAAAPAQAVVLGSPSSSSSTVRLIGPYYCSGVAIGSRLVVTAAHCANRRMRIMDGGGGSIVSVARSATLDDGRRVSVSGDAAILLLSSPLSG